MPLPDITLISTDIIKLNEQGVELHVLRLDKIHPVISGNKWFKLKYHLKHFRENDYDSIATFGGAWSNHIVATACMCAIEGIHCIGIIRGEQPLQLSHTLQTASEYGMKLHYIARSEYSHRNDASFVGTFTKSYPRSYLIPEGGAGVLGKLGITEMAKDLSLHEFDKVACSIGTGTMYEGLKEAIPSSIVLGFPAIRGYNATGPHMFCNYHFGGYAKYDDTLIRFMNELYRSTGIPTDIVYTGKLLYGIYDLASKGFFHPGSKICCIHSGGLQGNLSLPKGTLIF